MDNANVIDSTATPVASMNLVSVLRIPAIRQVLLLIGIAASVAAGFAIFFWSQSPGYTQLFSDLDTADTGQVAETLRAADIPVRIDTTRGTVLVPEGRIHDARLELAGQGLPAGLSAGILVRRLFLPFPDMQNGRLPILRRKLRRALPIGGSKA